MNSFALALMVSLALSTPFSPAVTAARASAFLHT